jgi:hypothetical protein
MKSAADEEVKNFLEKYRDVLLPVMKRLADK